MGIGGVFPSVGVPGFVRTVVVTAVSCGGFCVERVFRGLRGCVYTVYFRVFTAWL